jgi:hypothetical protein
VSLGQIAIVAAVFVVALLFVGVLVSARRAARRRQWLSQSRLRAPVDLQFVCAGCAQRFPHTKRTVGAFERGTTRLYCNACHTKWLSNRPRQPQPVAPGERSPRGAGATSQGAVPSRTGATRSRLSPSEARASGGCLGAALVLIAVPLALVVYAAVT